ncbi:MAG: hypothetical protein H0V62_11015 [Gammaproteobacteria bacterium]|nr:hypothetical protein [Gammaproteobacteria bacterium]
MCPTRSIKFRNLSLCLCLLGIAVGAPALAQDAFRGLEPADAFGAKPNRTVCPRIKPFKCESGDCVTNPTKCQATHQCPRDKPVRCADGACASKSRDCEWRERCPVARPYLCPTGGCAWAAQGCTATKPHQQRTQKRNRLPSLR